MKNRIPKPVDTSETELPDEIKVVCEEIARNTHSIWVELRQSEGWIYGPERNDVLKTHPCIVPFDELPESEREYDRRISSEVLRYIVKLGFTIEKKDAVHNPKNEESI